MIAGDSRSLFQLIGHPKGNQMNLQSAASGQTGVAIRTSVRWKIFLLMLLLISINYIDRASLSVAMPLVGNEFEINPALQGVVLSSFFWTYAFMQVPGGVLGDRFKPRVVITAATVGWGFFQAIAAASTNWLMLMLSRLGLGACEGPIYPAGGKLIAIWMTRNERARGAALLDGGAPLGAALGAIVITGLIGALNSWRLAFLAAGVATMLCGLWAWWYIRNTPREHPSASAEEIRYIEEAHAHEDAEAPVPKGAAGPPTSAITRSGACASAGCSSTQSSTACLHGCRPIHSKCMASTSRRLEALRSSSSCQALSVSLSEGGLAAAGAPAADTPTRYSGHYSVSPRSSRQFRSSL
jgi:Major Facilitator Superfamily